MRLPFKKYEGLKNDFIIIDLRNVDQEALQMQWGNQRLHQALCDRTSGVGADGVLALLPGTGALAHMKITNSDGSTPEMCGNGIRCVAQFLVDQGEAGALEPFVIQSDAGPKTINIQPAGIQVEMGLGRQIKDSQADSIWGANNGWHPPKWPNPNPLAWAVDMGNPHLVLDWAISKETIGEWGPAWAAHPFFPSGVNVGFSRVQGNNEIELQVWERGSGATWACGTGACAAALAWWQHCNWNGPVRVHLPGGKLEVDLAPNGENSFEIVMTGPARHVYSGEVPKVCWAAVGNAAK